MSSKIDKATSKSTRLKSEVQELQAQLASLAKSQAEMDKLRFETHQEYETAKTELNSGLTGVRNALSMLRDYYGAAASAEAQDGSFMQRMEQPTAPVKHSKAGGAGSSIVGLLEVIESDFAMNLAKEESQEAG